VNGEEDPLVRDDDEDEDKEGGAAEEIQGYDEFFEVQEQDPLPDPELEKLLENSIDCDVDMDSGRHAKIQLSPNQRAQTITEFLEHIDVDDHQDVLDLLDRQEQSTADDELLQRRFEQTTAVVC